MNITQRTIVGLLFFANLNLYAYDIKVDGICYNLNATEKTLTVARGDKYYEGYIFIPDEIEYNTQKLPVIGIEDEAFRNCHELLTVNIGNNVKSIGQFAFNFCEKLKSVIIGNGVENIGYASFLSCEQLESVTMGKSIKTIGNAAFMSCKSLQEIMIPASTEYIALKAFQYCNSLKRIIIEDSHQTLEFEDTDPLTGAPFGVSYHERNVEYVYQGRNLSFNYSVFSGLPIKNVEIGPYVTKIKDFVGCLDICYIKSLIENPERCVVEFSNTTYASAKLVVPEGTLTKYTLSDGWKNFFNIIENSSGNGDVDNEECVNLIIQHAENGSITLEIPKGSTYKASIKPNDGWEINSVTLNGADITDNLNIRGVFHLPELYSETILNITFSQTSNISKVSFYKPKVMVNGNTIIIKNIQNGQPIRVYETNGTLVKSVYANNGQTLFRLKPKQMYIVKILDYTTKISL